MDREGKKSITIPALRITQPIGDFYLGVMSAQDLCAISWVDMRRIGEEEGKLDQYLGIQRKLNKKRVKEIQQYVRTLDATFPTSVLLAVDEKCAKIQYASAGNITAAEQRVGALTLSNYPDPEEEDERILFGDIAKIIDGQHRIEGLRFYDDKNFEINVVVFVGSDVADQAMVFSTVNLAQTKVNRSLVYDLFSYAETRSPQKTCHEIVVALDNTEGSPFYKRIKRLGLATEGRTGETLAQATVVKQILKYISKNPELDQDLLKRGKKLALPSVSEDKALIFRRMFVEGQDLRIASIIWNYFTAIEQRWPLAWTSTGQGYVLNRTNGYEGFMRFLRPAYLNFTTSREEVSTEQFLLLFKRVELDDKDFTSDQFKPGTSGATAIYRELSKGTGLYDD